MGAPLLAVAKSIYYFKDSAFIQSISINGSNWLKIPRLILHNQLASGGKFERRLRSVENDVNSPA